LIKTKDLNGNRAERAKAPAHVYANSSEEEFLYLGENKPRLMIASERHVFFFQRVDFFATRFCTLDGWGKAGKLGKQPCAAMTPHGMVIHVPQRLVVSLAATAIPPNHPTLDPTQSFLPCLFLSQAAIAGGTACCTSFLC
jgi:hypothetical protein